MNNTNRYFEVELKDEVCNHVFDEKCNFLDFDNPRFLQCCNVDGKDTKLVLAMFPYDRINAIFNKEKNDV